MAEEKAKFQTSDPREVVGALLFALEPFYTAARLGVDVADMVDQVPNLRQKTGLIAFSSYAGKEAAQSHVSWANWMRIVEIIEEFGFDKTFSLAKQQLEKEESDEEVQSESNS